jgi:hypothetical protein
MKLSFAGRQAAEHRNSCDPHLWPGLVSLPHPGAGRLSSGYHSKLSDSDQTNDSSHFYLICKSLKTSYTLFFFLLAGTVNCIAFYEF